MTDIKRLEVHERYKKVLQIMLEAFYFDCYNEDFATPEHLSDFIRRWVESKIKPPCSEWNPGDRAK